MQPQRNFGLDLVRATALALVLLSHCGDIFALWLGGRNLLLLSYGGQFGVQLFFVLSGLLIGGLLIRQMDAPVRQGAGLPHVGQRFGVFMLRRWMRTLPSFYVWGGVLAIMWAPILWGALASARLAASLPLYVVMGQNLAWPMRAPGFYDVTWSLAVEEWFYLGFAGLLFGLWRLVGARLALLCAIATFLAGPPLLRWWAGYDPASHSHVAVFWLDAIAVGVVAAWVQARRPRWFAAASWLLPIAVALVVLMYAGGLQRLHVPQRWERVFDVDLQAVGLALWLPAASRWRVAHGAAAWIVRRLSRHSYSIYLVHLSVLEYVGAHRFGWTGNGAALIAISVAAITLLSLLLSELVEHPIMALRPGAGAAASPQRKPAMPAYR